MCICCMAVKQLPAGGNNSYYQLLRQTINLSNEKNGFQNN